MNEIVCRGYVALGSGCMTCCLGTANSDGTIACGAPFEEFKDGTQLPGPVWAERKRSLFFMVLIATGSDYSALKSKYGDDFFPSYEADRMHPLDGAECKIWKPSSANMGE